MENFTLPFYKIFNGNIVIGHRPGGKKLPFSKLKYEKITIILTLQCENEDTEFIRKNINLLNIEWIWFPCKVNELLSNKLNDKIIELYKTIELHLKKEEKIYIHCSAGIHRTGMITYGLLRYFLFNPIQTRQILKDLRTITFDNIGEERLLWGDQFFEYKLNELFVEKKDEIQNQINYFENQNTNNQNITEFLFERIYEGRLNILKCIGKNCILKEDHIRLVKIVDVRFGDDNYFEIDFVPLGSKIAYGTGEFIDYFIPDDDFWFEKFEWSGDLSFLSSSNDENKIWVFFNLTGYLNFNNQSIISFKNENSDWEIIWNNSL